MKEKLNIKTQFYFVTPNSFLTLPPVKQMYLQFKSQFEIRVLQSEILDYEDFFESVSSYNRINTYQNYSAYHKQGLFEKFTKIIKFIFLFLNESLRGLKKERKRIVYTNELFSLFIALLFKKKTDVVIYHQFEVLGNHLNKLDFLSYWYLKRNLKKLNLAIFPEENRSRHFFENLGQNIDNKVFILPNSNNNTVVLRKRAIAEKIIVTHIGSVGYNHHLDSYIKAIAQLEQDNYEFRFIGRLPKELLKTIEQQQLTNVKLIGQVQHFELEKYYLETDIGVVLYKDTGVNYRYCAPNKLYEYWSYGIPVIGDLLPGLISAFKNENLGTLVDMQSPKSIINVIRQISYSYATKVEVFDYFQKHLKLEIYLNNLQQKLESKAL